MDDVFLVLALALLAAGVVGLVKGSLPALRIGNRKAAGFTLVAAFVALMIGGALAEPSPTGAPQTEETPTASASPGPARTTEPPLELDPPPAPAPAARPSGIPPEAQEATVVRHVDGDTFWAEGGTLPPGTSSSVRLLEVDTPESTTQTQCYGPDAAAFTRAELPLGSKVYLLADRGDTDRFGRFLRYVWKPNGEFFNEKLARQGYARAVVIAPNDRYISLMRQAEAAARAEGLGLWGACGSGAAAAPPAAIRPPAPPPAAPAPNPVPPPAPAAPAGGCHPSYPDFCVAPPPPDLDCADIGRQLTVLPPDPHRLDGQPGQAGEPDGAGCESYP